MNKDELGRVFTDVRKAYRLLHGYHTRIIDSAKLIGKNICKEAVYLSYESDIQILGPRNLLESSSWKWDATPLISVAFIWEKRLEMKGRTKDSEYSIPGDLYIDVKFIADSVFDEAIKPKRPEEPKPEEMGDPEDAMSLVRLSIIKCIKEKRDTNFWKIWSKPRSKYPDGPVGLSIWEDVFMIYSELHDATKFVDSGSISSICELFKQNAVHELDINL